MSTSSELLNKLATYDEELSEKDKASKLLRTIKEYFSGFAMIAQVQELQFERIIQAMHAEISRRKSVKGSNSQKETLPKALTAGMDSNKKNHDHSHDGRVSKHRHGNNDSCYVCGKKGH